MKCYLIVYQINKIFLQSQNMLIDFYIFIALYIYYPGE